MNIRVRVLGAIAAFVCLILLAGCAGVSSGPQTQTPPPANNPTAGQLTVKPSTLSFGNVTVGGNAVLTGTLTASTADVTVSSAAWNGSGYSISGITFPVTVATGKSVNYGVTFTPATAGTASGSISFLSDASDSPLKQSFTGDGTEQAKQHSVALSWDPSTSSVIGYNLYRGTQSGGPYSKINPGLQTGTTYTDSSVVSGATYYYVATSVDSNQVESPYSNQTVAQIPNP